MTEKDVMCLEFYVLGRVTYRYQDGRDRAPSNRQLWGITAALGTLECLTLFPVSSGKLKLSVRTEELVISGDRENRVSHRTTKICPPSTCPFLATPLRESSAKGLQDMDDGCQQEEDGRRGRWE
ncbi:hypothetical protein Q5P01_018537 [Channa striata]|uniref:Uncharacterized protein n=1 Tax=Channa striata TaxID=64152 RepID=A0AA88M5F7_CHASR|nr:hypothetical protein Q5P01_018537 [Channa striata]